jgi:hypothetical protein
MPSLPSNSCWMRARSGRNRPARRGARAARTRRRPVRESRPSARCSCAIPGTDAAWRTGSVPSAPAGSRKKSCRLASRAARYSDSGPAPRRPVAASRPPGPVRRRRPDPACQPLDQLLELDQHAFQRRQAGDAAQYGARPARPAARPAAATGDRPPGGCSTSRVRARTRTAGIHPSSSRATGSTGKTGKRRARFFPVRSRLATDCHCCPSCETKHLERLRDTVAVLAGAVASDQDAATVAGLGSSI